MLIKLLIYISVYILIYNESFSNANKDNILSYLGSFDSLKSDFIQINNNGDILSGNLYISRPGKFRIEYDQIPILLISDSKRLAVINKDLKSISFHKFDEIPAGFFLFKGLSFKEIKILELEKKDNTLSASIVNTKLKDKGIIKIIFELDPLKMKKWVIIKKDNSKTEVFFDKPYFNTNIPQVLYDIDKEDPRKIPFKIN